MIILKYCVSGRQPRSILKKADEIKLQYKDRDILLDYTQEMPDKTFILYVPKSEIELDWELYRAYSSKVNFILCIENLNMAQLCFENDIKYYWAYPVMNWYELNGLIDMRPQYIILGAPLSFDLIKVKNKTQIPLRLCPNLAFDAYIPRKNGIYGTWIRPEDVKVYEEWIDVLEFITTDLKQEATLLHVYKDNGYWPGNLNLLFTNFNINVDNRGLPEEIGETRANCGQRCMMFSNCHFCETAMKFSNALRKRHFEEKKIIPAEIIEQN